MNGQAKNEIDFGKLPPQAKDLEEAILGAVLIESMAINSVINILHEDCFYVDAHRIIYKAIVSLFHEHLPIDMLTVPERLKSTGELDLCGGYFYIQQLTMKVGSAANVEYHSMVDMDNCYMHIQLP